MILSKPMGMTLPLALLVIDAFPLRRFSTEKLRPLLLEKIPYFALLIVAVLLTSIGLSRADALDAAGQTYPLVHSFAQPGYRISFYVLKTLIPWPLSPLYWFRPEIGMAQAVGLLVVWRHRRRPGRRHLAGRGGRVDRVRSPDRSRLGRLPGRRPLRGGPVQRSRVPPLRGAGGGRAARASERGYGDPPRRQPVPPSWPR
jgi:hypothetical protein